MNSRIFFIVSFFLLVACSDQENKQPKETREPNVDSAAAKPMGLQTIRSSKIDDSLLNAELVPNDALIDEFRFVLNNRFIVLQSQADSVVAIGDPQMLDWNVDPASVVRQVNMKSISDTMKGFLGQEFYMLSKEGDRFLAKITKLKLMVAYFPPYGEIELAENTKVVDSVATAWNYWHEGLKYSVFLVGEIDTTVSPSRHVLGAVPVQPLETPRVFDSDTSAILKETIEEAMTHTAQYSLVKADFLKVNSEHNNEQEWTSNPNADEFICAMTNNETFCTLAVSAGDLCGGYFYGEINTAWKVGRDHKPELLFSLPSFCITQMILDIDGDGIPEFLCFDWSDQMTLYKKVNGKWKAVTHLPMMDMRCPC